MKRNRLIVLALMLIGLMNAQKVCAWKGSTPDAIVDAATVDATSDAAKFYLYNVGTGKFLTQGGVWGTSAVVAGDGMQFSKMTKSSGLYFFQTPLNDNNGCLFLSTGWTTKNAYYLFLDQKASGEAKDVYNYTVQAVEGATNVYTISTENYGYDITVDRYGGPIEGMSKGTYYISVDADGNCKAVELDESDDNRKWMFVTLKEIKQNFEYTEGTEANPAYAPHLLKDAGFYRENSLVTEWKLGEDRNTSVNNYYIYDVNGKGTPILGVAAYNNGLKPADALGRTITTPAMYNYIVTCTYYTDWKRKQTDYHEVTVHSETSLYDLTEEGKSVPISGYKCGTYHPYGIKSQTITLDSKTSASTTTTGAYTYHVGNGYNMCQTSGKFEDGVTYSNAYYQEPFGGYWTANIHGTKGSISQLIKPERAGWWKVSAKGFSNDGTGYLFAYAGTTNQPNTDKYQVQPFNTVDTVATGINTYVKASKYLNTTESQSVTVYVDETDNLIFGAYIQNGKADSWTCFDDFTLAYLGKGELNLIIDEENEEIANINDQMIPDKNQTLRLTRSFKTNQWNSLVLPVKLTAQQVKTAFGADTKLSYLHETSLDGKRIFFEKVDLSVDDADAIEAGKLYIIKPQNAMPEKQNVKERTFENRTKITSSDSYYTINQVSLTRSDLIADVEETDFVPSTEDNGIKMVGTYVKKGTAVAGGTQAIPAYSYILGTPSGATDSKWYYTTVAVNNVKGLRGWIQTGKSESAAGVKFVINGVEEGEVTAIEGIESSMEVSKRINSNIYNLNGQLVRSNSVSAEGLDKGIYIIGGKKVVVK